MNIEAVKTEYRGILFKSKSEAIFARMLDGYGLNWQYEPDLFSVGNYTPDFLVWCTFMSCLIEYKPKEPTRAYMDKLFDIFTCKEWKFNQVNGVLVYCDPFNDDSEAAALQPNIVLAHEKAWMGAPFAPGIEVRARLKIASAYRFDLAA